ncbi:chemotaxis protein CheA [uncultured Sphingomonas sp.]|uniref:chemotaxis protein CheA n=1 Tax=uncultured Sphingomonas sp. TaxID=158754 RepID=UPI0035CB55C3
MDDLLQEFIAETRETLEALAGEIVAWEADPADRNRLDAIFRFVHTVKGSCGFLDLPRLARLSHAAEDVLAAVRDGTRAPDTRLVNAVLAVVDRIGELVEAIDSGISLDDSSDDLLIAALGEDAHPALAAAPPPTAPGAARAASRSVRLHVDLLDRMMGGMSDMVLARNELARALRAHAPDPRVEAALERLSGTVADMRDSVTRTRMQKVEALFSAVPRMVRDTAAELGKQVALIVEGTDVELDREMIELMRDPLVHIIRNAIDHGLETPDERRAAGKRETGRLTICARQSGNRILIEVEDDGRGIDVARLAAKALAKGLHGHAALTAMTEAQRLALVFEPGLSSRDEVSAISGRGVGMDVVRANIEQIGGRIDLCNKPGEGLALTIHVPLTLSILPTIVVGVGAHRFALPRQAVEEIVSVAADGVRLDQIGDAPVASVRGRRLALVALGEVLGVAGGAAAGRGGVLAIVATRDGNYALAVDTVIDTEEVVVKPAAPAVMATGCYAGQTLPDSGLPMLLLDGAGIAAVAGLALTRATDDGEEEAAAAAPGVPALLFEDLDGERRLVALAAVDRVETVFPGAVRRTAGRLHLTLGDQLMPLHLTGPIGERATLAVLRLSDGATELAYAVAEPIEIVTLPSELAPGDGGAVAGVVLLGGEQVEVVDVHALFAGGGRTLVERPLCLLADDGSGWMAAFLRPVLEGAGYRCADRLAPGETAAVTLAMADAATDDPAALRLSREVGQGLYRYDRAGLLAAVAGRIAGERR